MVVVPIQVRPEQTEACVGSGAPSEDIQLAGDFPTPGMDLTHILVVSDLARSVHWYESVLGAQLHREYGESSAVFDFNGVWLLLVTAGDPTADKPGTTFAAPSTHEIVDHSFTIRVQDCRQAYETLQSRGAAFLTPPYNWVTEIRCFFPDPDGHLFEISEIPTAG